jgi:hypothetical protein
VSAQLYPSAQAALEDGALDWLDQEMRVVLMGPSFVPDFTAQYYDQLPVAPAIAVSSPLENRSFDDGVAQSSAAEFLQLLSTLSVVSAVLFQDTGDPAYSPLVAFYTGENFLGSPFTLQGLDQFVYPDAQLGWLTFEDAEFSGEINSYESGGDETLALGEVLGGTEAPASVIFIGGRLTVRTQKVCVRAEEPDDCCEPEIRSSICE